MTSKVANYKILPVEKINGEGVYFKKALDVAGRLDDEYEYTKVLVNDEALMASLEDEVRRIESIPEIDQRSMMFYDVVDGQKRRMQVLSAPVGTTQNRIRRPDTSDLPPADRTYVAHITKYSDPSAYMTELLLVNNEWGAIKVGKRLAQSRGWVWDDIYVTPEHVDPEDFIIRLKDKIDLNIPFKEHLLEYSDMRAYNDKVNAAREQNTP